MDKIIRLIDEEDDDILEQEEHDDLPFDIYMDDKSYCVAKYPNFVHSYMGDTALCNWAWPRGEKRSSANMIPYIGYLGAEWSFNVESRNYFRKDCIEKCVRVRIYRNGKLFDENVYGFFDNCLSFAVADTLTRIQRYKDLPCNLDHYRYAENLYNRKIYYKDNPAIITNYYPGDGCIMIKVIDGILRAPHNIAINMALQDEEDAELNVELLDTNIDWFRD